MVGPLYVSREFVGMEIDRAQLARGEARRLVRKMGGCGVPARAARADRECAHPGAELYHRNEGVSGLAIGLPGPRLASGSVGSERAPLRGGEGDWPARRRIVETRRRRGVE